MTNEHWGYILLAYGVTAATVVVLLLRTIVEHRRLQRELARLEKGGGDREEAI